MTCVVLVGTLPRPAPFTDAERVGTARTCVHPEEFFEKPVDIVIVGCPHATFDEVREVARLVKGRKVKEASSSGCRPTRPPT